MRETWLPDTDVAARILETVQTEEEVERDLVDASDLEDSVLD